MKQIPYATLIFFILFSIFSSEKTIGGVYSPPPIPCGAPTNISVGSTTSSTALVSWDTVPGALKYNISWRIVGDTVWSSVGVLAQNNQVKLTNLSAGEEYELKMRTFCISGYRKHSGFASGPNFTTVSVCVGPDKLNTDNVTSTSADGSWIPSINSIQYRVRIRKIGNSSWTQFVLAGGAGTTSFNFTGLESSTNYEWQVRAKCTLTDFSRWSESEVFTTLCGEPTNISIGDILSSSTIATWDTLGNAYKYRLRRRAVGDVDWVYSSVFAPEHQRKFVNLLAGTEYEFQVQSYCDSSLVDSSGYISGPNFTTLTDCVAPDGLSTTGVTETTATANWNVAANADQYRVRIREAGDTSWTISKINGGNAASHPFTGLNPSTDYEWQIRSICGSINDYSGFSDIQLFTTWDLRLSEPEAGNNQVEPLNLYPSPSKGRILVEMNTGCSCSSNAQIEIINTLGQNVYAGNIVTDNGHIKTEINLNDNLVNGMYFIRISQGSNSYNTHFILSK